MTKVKIGRESEMTMKRIFAWTSKHSFLSLCLLLVATVWGGVTWSRSPIADRTSHEVTAQPDADERFLCDFVGFFRADPKAGGKPLESRCILVVQRSESIGVAVLQATDQHSVIRIAFPVWHD